MIVGHCVGHGVGHGIIALVVKDGLLFNWMGMTEALYSLISREHCIF